MALTRGEIAVVVMPGDFGKPRPAVIVQSVDLGEATTTVLVCPMSSDLQEFRILRPIVEPTAGNGLRVRSQIMTDKIFPLRRESFRRTIGSLDTTAIERLDRALLVVLGLAR
jgi:mRNA interferase MazF